MPRGRIARLGATADFHHGLLGTRSMVAALLLLASAPVLSQTTQSPPEGLILGRVVDGVTGQPVPEAFVLVGANGIGPGSVLRRTLSDADGRFVAFRLPPAAYAIVAEKDGYGDGYLGNRGPGARLTPQFRYIGDTTRQRLTLGAGERRGDVVVTLWKYGAIAGRVVDHAGQPLAGVHVQAWPRVMSNDGLRWGSLLPLVGWTDDRGEYRIVHAVAAEYVVVVPAVSLTLPYSLPPTGRSSSYNIPIYGLLGLREPAGEYRDQFPRAGQADTVSTGGWLESVVGRRSLRGTAGESRGYATTFAPGVMDPAAATPVTVAPGVDGRAVDIQLTLQTLHVVSGVLTGPAGPLAHRTVTLHTIAGTSRWQVAIGVSKEDGAFRLSGIPAGQYVLDAVAWPGRGAGGYGPIRHVASTVWITNFRADPFSGQPTLWARRQVTVGDADLDGVQLTMQAGARLSGRVEFRGTSPAPQGADLDKVALDLDRPDGWDLAAQASTELDVADSGAFTSLDLPVGQYLIRAPQPPAGWTLSAVMHAGRDISVDPVDLGTSSIDDIAVIFTDDPPRVSGTVSDANAQPSPAATVVAFPRDERLWRPLGTYPRRLMATRVDREGRFALVGLPAGDYIVAAMDEAEMVAWPRRELLSMLARAGRNVRVQETTKIEIALRMVPVR